MADNTANLEVLIQIREELAGLQRTQQGLRETKQEATSLGTVLKQGLGIGSGIAIATGAVALLKNTLVGTVREAFQFAAQTKDMSEALGISTTRLQVLRLELQKAGVDVGRLNMAISAQTQSLAEARDAGSGAAAAYRTLGLEAAQIEALPIEERLLAVARAMERSADKTQAFHAGAQILGNRGLPQLLNALRGLGGEGFSALEKLYEKQGQIMGEDTLQRLDAAEKQWTKFWHGMVIGSGEALGLLGRFAESAKKAPGQTMWALAQSMIGGPAMFGNLAGVIAKNTQPQLDKPTAPSTAAALPLAQTTAWRKLELDLMRAQNAEAVIQASAWETEADQRRKLIPVLAEQMRLEKERLAALRDTERTSQENQADRERAITEAEGRVALLQQKVIGNKLGAKPRVFTAMEEYKDINNPDRPGYMTASQGVATGFKEWMVELGSTGEQVAGILKNSLGQALSGLGSDIWDAMQGTIAWGDAFRNLGNVAGRMLTQIITQMIVMQGIKAALGLFGFELSGAPVPSITRATAAGGGSFLTSGPTQFTVGDNPGGVELVNVIPISGIGQSTINGQAIRMAGGGAAMVAGGPGSSKGGGGDTFNFSYSFAGGVSREEVLALIPRIVDASKAGVLEAQRRHRDGFR